MDGDNDNGGEEAEDRGVLDETLPTFGPPRRFPQRRQIQREARILVFYHHILSLLYRSPQS